MQPNSKIKRSQQWSTDNVSCNVLYSRAGIATQIILTDKIKNKHILIDCGDGTTRDILNASIELCDIQGIIISHGHPDHIGGLFSLLSTLRLFKVKQNITIYAPSGCTEACKFFELFMSLYKDSLPFSLNYIEIKADSKNSIGEFNIKPFSAFHYETTKISQEQRRLKPTYGYKIQLYDKLIIYSSDTLPNARLEEEAKNASLLIIEATYDDSFSENEPNHLSLEYAQSVAQNALDYLIIHRF